MQTGASSTVFEVRIIHPEDGRVETGSFDIKPQHDQAEKVCGLFREFLAGRPQEFRAPVPFLKRGNVELDWSAAPGGVAFATFYEDGEAATLGVLVSRIDEEADNGILDGFEQQVIAPLLGEVPEDLRTQLYASNSASPLLISVVLPGRAELGPMFNLLNTSLAAVYFGAIRKMHAQK